MGVDEPGQCGAPLGVQSLVGRGCGRGRPDPGDPVAVGDDGGVVQDPEQPVAQGRVVGDELTDTGDEERRGHGATVAHQVRAAPGRAGGSADQSSGESTPSADPRPCRLLVLHGVADRTAASRVPLGRATSGRVARRGGQALVGVVGNVRLLLGAS